MIAGGATPVSLRRIWALYEKIRKVLDGERQLVRFAEMAAARQETAAIVPLCKLTRLNRSAVLRAGADMGPRRCSLRSSAYGASIRGRIGCAGACMKERREDAASARRFVCGTEKRYIVRAACIKLVVVLRTHGRVVENVT